jgi:DNA-directed RNA polymerase subunit RPC12/RpoP
MKKDKMFTCSNPSCGKAFATPLQTLNLQDSTEPYMACPYCLTRIKGEETKVKAETKEEICASREKGLENKIKPPTCHYHLGYLSERVDKQQVPDECIVCKSLIECMLQKMKA